MDIDICITRAVYCTLKEYGVKRLTRWAVSMARRRMRLARAGRVLHV